MNWMQKNAEYSINEESDNLDITTTVVFSTSMLELLAS